MHSFSESLTHSLTHSLTYSLTRYIQGVVQLDLDTSELTPFILPTPSLPPKMFSELLHAMLSCNMGSEHNVGPV